MGLERIKSESSDNWSESDLETESDLSFVVSDSESDEVHLAKKSARGINSKSVEKNLIRSLLTNSKQLSQNHSSVFSMLKFLNPNSRQACQSNGTSGSSQLPVDACTSQKYR